MRDLSDAGGAYARAVAAIDDVNARDPSSVVVRGEELPLALAHGRLAAEWVAQLLPAPRDVVLLAARAHHLSRWELPRASYPAGRAGYLRWRRDQKARHARDVAALLADAGYGGDDVRRVQDLVRRVALATDVEAQAVEDAACLVFLETQLADVASRLLPARLAEVLRQTAGKMSPGARAAIADVPLDAASRAFLDAALA